MKNSKSFRIISLILALVMLLSALTSISAFASEEEAQSSEAATPRIISQNVMYGGNFSLMFAVDASTVSGSTVSLTVYGEYPNGSAEAIWKKTVSSSSDLTEVNGTSCYVFTTPGVAAKDMDKNYYVVAESAGVKSEVKKYSVAEYLYERLYANGTAFAPEALRKAQADLYRSVLQMGRDAQDLLFNHDDDTANDRTTFVTDLYYLVCEGGLFNGESTTLLTDGKAPISLVSDIDGSYTAINWDVKYIDKDGGVTVASKVRVSGDLPTSHMIITPAELSVAPTKYTFNSSTSVNSSAIKSNNSKTTVISLDEINGSPAAKVELLGFEGLTSGKYYETTTGFSTSTKDSVMTIYEADVTLPELPDGLTSVLYTFQIRASIVYSDGSEAGKYPVSIKVYTTSNGNYITDTQGNRSETFYTNSFKLRIEYFTEIHEGTEKATTDIYIDNEFMVKNRAEYIPFTTNVPYAVSPDVFQNLYLVPDNNLPAGTVIYFDNIVNARLAVNATSDASVFDSAAYDLDGLKEISPSFASGSTTSLVEYNGSTALKFDTSSSSGEEMFFYTQSIEDGADLFVFEADIYENHPGRVSFKFMAKDGTEIYNFLFNGAGTFITENNNVSWGANSYPANSCFKFRVEMKVTDGLLDFNVYINGVQLKRPGSYGKYWNTDSKNLTLSAEKLFSISKLQIIDAQPTVSGEGTCFIFDNIKFSAVNTQK